MEIEWKITERNNSFYGAHMNFSFGSRREEERESIGGWIGSNAIWMI